MENSPIGWIGLGNMGAPMSQRLIAAGYPLTVYNRTSGKEAALKAAGASTAATPAELITRTDVLFIMVSDDAAVKDIFQGDNGLLQRQTSGKLLVNMSTVSPGISRQMADLCRKQGNEYLDAPVSGSVKQAQEGQLVIMVGGAKPAYEKASPLLQHLGRLSLHLGDHGAGNTAKLAINVLLGFHAQGLAEATLFAQRHGIRTEDFMNIFNNSAMANVFGRAKGEAIMAENYKAAFALKLIAKDLRLAHAEGLDTPLAETSFRTFQQAERTFGDLDIIAVIKQVAQPPTAAPTPTAQATAAN
ncbi:MAG TPA: NAD(P)-dependent oxidoreductase [Puia sp.]|nr:NAD(P)-dependent oxidoreductase [Puia sp.]